MNIISMSVAGGIAPLVSPETRRLVNLSRERGWDCAVLGRAPLPEEPVRLGDWLAVPVDQDSSLVPVRALERVQAIYAAGLRPLGFVLVHEAPGLLPAPEQTGPASWQMPSLPPQLKSALTLAAGALGVLAVGVVAVAGVVVLAVAAIGLAAILAVPLFLVAGAAVVDPILVAVTEDGYWVEIVRWES